MSATPAVWTIGHSNHTAERLLELLREHGITAVADVRTSPYSAYSSTFNREQLQRLLETAGITYAFLARWFSPGDAGWEGRWPQVWGWYP